MPQRNPYPERESKGLASRNEDGNQAIIVRWTEHVSKGPRAHHVPLEQFKVRCSKCLEENHMVYSYKNEMRCSRCRERGHHRKDCVQEDAVAEERHEKTEEQEENARQEAHENGNNVTKPEERPKTPNRESRE